MTISIIILRVKTFSLITLPKCYAEGHILYIYAECCYTKCQCAQCRGAVSVNDLNDYATNCNFS
jgi:hypothetical protein